MLFSSLFSVFEFEFEKIRKFENPRWRPLVTSLCCCGCHGNQLSSKWFRLIECKKNVHYMYQISSQSDEWCKSRGEGSDWPSPIMPLCNFFRLMPSRFKKKAHLWWSISRYLYLVWRSWTFWYILLLLSYLELKLYRPLLCPAEIKGKSVTDHQQDTWNVCNSTIGFGSIKSCTNCRPF